MPYISIAKSQSINRNIDIMEASHIGSLRSVFITRLEINAKIVANMSKIAMEVANL